MKTRVAAFALALALAGCAVGPDFQRPPAPRMEAFLPAPAQAGDQEFAAGAGVPARWWALFHSPALNALVEQSLKANPNIQAAEAALRAAREAAAAQAGGHWPQAGAALAPTRNRIADSLSSPLNSPANPFSLHTAQVTVSYAPDVFGATRRQVESFTALAEYQSMELEAARLTLSANVVLAAIQEASLRGQIEDQEALVRIETQILALVEGQAALGAISEAGVREQQAALAQAQAALPPLRKQLALNRDLLIALTGALPDRDLTVRFDLDALHLPRELPLSLPADLVTQRPDVRAAEALAHAAAAQVGVALANRLPQFNIDASVGSVASTLGTLFKAGGGFWSLAGLVTQPLFQGGTLVHRQAGAEAAYEQALAQYRATLLAAYQNVADCLHALDQDARAYAATDAAEKAAHRTLELALTQLQLGDIARFDYLPTERAYRQARSALVQARANRLADTAALFQALGGGWWKPAG